METLKLFLKFLLFTGNWWIHTEERVEASRFSDFLRGWILNFLVSIPLVILVFSVLMMFLNPLHAFLLALLITALFLTILIFDLFLYSL